MPIYDELFNRVQIAALLGKSVDSVRRMERSETNPDGPLETVKVGRSVRIKAGSVQSYLDASSPGGSGGAALSPPVPVPSIPSAPKVTIMTPPAGSPQVPGAAPEEA